ncbi:MAG TPA: cytochrome c [Thermomicrobiales bacterium]|nr:cytochrome c [Thermomicrobiales bacterium]
MMRIANSVTSRLLFLVAALAAAALISIPLLGNAQDSSPVPEQSPDEQLAYGEAIYTNVCIACHQPDGAGIPGIYLPLNNNPLLTNEDPTYFVTTVLEGRGGMPNFNYIYDDQEIAAVVSYVRQAWDNDAPPVTAQEVADIRAAVVGTPVASPTPEGQRPGGQTTGATGPHGTPMASPQATPES